MGQHQRGTPVAAFQQNIQQVFRLGVGGVFIEVEDDGAVEGVFKIEEQFVLESGLSVVVFDLGVRVNLRVTRFRQR